MTRLYSRRAVQRASSPTLTQVYILMMSMIDPPKCIARDFDDISAK